MPSLKRARRLTLGQSLTARPIRSAAAELTRREDGGLIRAPARPPRWAAWLLRVPPAATRQFELDAVGLFVWDQCDGKNTVRQVIGAVARRYNLTPREAEVATRQFLQTLARKGLLAFAVTP